MDLYQKLVEESGEYSYVVDKKNFDMVFANSKITNLKGNSYLGKKCYEYLLNSSKQCEKCIVTMLLAHYSGICSIISTMIQKKEVPLR